MQLSSLKGSMPMLVRHLSEDDMNIHPSVLALPIGARMRLRKTERRRSLRQAVELLAQCRSATGKSGFVVITDLTGEGCRLFSKSLPLSKGLHVQIRPEKSDCLAGVVRWASRGHAGIEFVNPPSR